MRSLCPELKGGAQTNVPHAVTKARKTVKGDAMSVMLITSSVCQDPAQNYVPSNWSRAPFAARWPERTAPST